MRLSEVAEGRDNNLNLIRMIAATSVLISHAYPIALGPGAAQPLHGLTGITLGGLSVYVFFAVSGFLITQSFANSPTLSRWMVARALRIIPGLAVVTVLTAFVMRPLVTSLPLADYFRQAETWTYVPRNLSLYFLQYPLPGVFETSPYGPPINGSLWTLIHEVLCYLGVLIAGVSGILASRRLFAACLAAFLAIYLVSTLYLPDGMLPIRAGLLIDLAFPFAIGSAFYVWRRELQLNWWIGAALAALAIVASGTDIGRPVLVLALSYWVFLLGYVPQGRIRAYNRLGDYSYGTYIYAFPLQQLAVYLFPGTGPVENILLSLPATLICAVLSWHLVESPALALRSRFGRRRDLPIAQPVAVLVGSDPRGEGQPGA